ncbi:hypothetical protein AG1IA_09482 [Rhizoctonia solani AG-1 IA]|uniref:Uncharacterized protein n=1 Tax=Thanatephorus cucumeris (strain AG1-IA) TaxID=983506 RepID=L8WID1_THACA|nr:hypothetical protein AG1IA_09482 [Rhizoctonia solani AG-1 IA]
MLRVQVNSNNTRGYTVNKKLNSERNKIAANNNTLEKQGVVFRIETVLETQEYSEQGGETMAGGLGEEECIYVVRKVEDQYFLIMGGARETISQVFR